MCQKFSKYTNIENIWITVHVYRFRIHIHVRQAIYILILQINLSLNYMIIYYMARYTMIERPFFK